MLICWLSNNYSIGLSLARLLLANKDSHNDPVNLEGHLQWMIKFLCHVYQVILIS